MFTGIGQSLGRIGLAGLAWAGVSVVMPPPDGTIPNGALLFDGKPLLFDGNFIMHSGV